MAKMTEMPETLVALAAETKPTSYAEGLVKHFEGDVMSALNYDQISNPRGGAMTLPSFMASVKLEVSTNERLAKAMFASPGSFAKALLLAAQCKLLVGGSYDLFYLIPRWNKKLGVEEITPLIGYKGLCELAQRHPRIHKVDAQLVFEGETFSYNAGTGQLDHQVSLSVERTEEAIVGGYARVVITDPAGVAPVLDDPVVHVMTRSQLMRIKEGADSWKQGERNVAKGWTAHDPWHQHPLAMHRKTLLRAVLNGGSVPRDMGLGGAISQDDAAQVTPDQGSADQAFGRQGTGDKLRHTLGLDDQPQPFGTVSEAVAAIEAAQSQSQLREMRVRWDHFTDASETKEISEAYDRCMFLLEDVIDVAAGEEECEG
jgi:phage RecT family recombinase